MTLLEWRRNIEEALSKGGIKNAAQEAKWLLAGALKRESSFVILNPSYKLTSSEKIVVQEWLQRRVEREPLSRIKGIREFWSLPFHLNKHTLDPRPETEGVVEGVLHWVGDRSSTPWRILDLGTGSGCLLITLLHELRNATGVGVDMSEEALAMARSNAKLNHVNERATFLQSNWGENVEGCFDIIVSNPPYIPLTDKATLAKEVLDFDPHVALFGGEDGLGAYRILAAEVKSFLQPYGLGIFEMGYGQRQAIEKIFHAAKFKTHFVFKDLAGLERIIGFCIDK